VKRRIEANLCDIIGPIRERRAALARDPDFVMDVLRAGTAIARDVTATTQAEVHAGLGLFTWT
jgi:tryptophanyl-tRNA synthetase